MIGIGSFREAIRTARVTHPIAFLVATLLAFAVICFGFALVAADPLRTVVTISGAACIGVALFTVVYALLFRPDLLRSEQHVIRDRLVDILADAETDASLRVSLSDALPRLSGQEPRKRKDEVADVPPPTQRKRR